MSQISGAFTVEVDLDRLVEVIAHRVAEQTADLAVQRLLAGGLVGTVAAAAAEAAARTMRRPGCEVYDREPGPDPGPGCGPGGVRHGDVVDEDGTVVPADEDGGGWVG